MLTFNNKAIKVGSNNVWIHTWPSVAPRTLRFRFLGVRYGDYQMPVTLSFLQSLQEIKHIGAVWTQVAENVFDWHYDDTVWGNSTASKVPLFKDTYTLTSTGSVDSILKYYYFDIVEGDFSGVTTIANLFKDDNAVHINALRNMTSITDASYAFSAHGTFSRQSLLHIDNLFMPSLTNASYMFANNGKLATPPTVTTQNCTHMLNMFNYCQSLTYLPLYDTSSATDTRGMFSKCYAVESGALALYTQASTQTNPPSKHTDMFLNCGRDTVTGAAELAQIPSDWGGTGA